MNAKRQLFAANLRRACGMHPLISQICREIGLNRQQFSRYTNGQALPSAYNRLRIARMFGIEPEDLDMPREAGAGCPATFYSMHIRETLRRWIAISGSTRPIISQCRGRAGSCAPARI
jgi:transcriptional regulator with XRE-family HTH domain